MIYHLYLLQAREISQEGQGLTAVEKIFNKNMVGVKEGNRFTRRFGCSREGKYCWFAGHHRSDDFSGIGSHGCHHYFSNRRWGISVRLSHRIGLGQESSGKHSQVNELHAEFLDLSPVVIPMANTMR